MLIHKKRKKLIPDCGIHFHMRSWKALYYSIENYLMTFPWLSNLKSYKSCLMNCRKVKQVDDSAA